MFLLSGCILCCLSRDKWYHSKIETSSVNSGIYSECYVASDPSAIFPISTRLQALYSLDWIANFRTGCGIQHMTSHSCHESRSILTSLTTKNTPLTNSLRFPNPALREKQPPSHCAQSAPMIPAWAYNCVPRNYRSHHERRKHSRAMITWAKHLRGVKEKAIV